MKTIGLNAVILTPRSGGILVYFQRLLDQLLKLNLAFRPRVFFSKGFLQTFPEYRQLENTVGISLSGANPRTRILCEPFIWPKLIKKYNLAAIQSPFSYTPFGIHIPTTVTIHDLRSFHDAEFYSGVRARFLNYVIQRSANRAARVIAISDYTRNDIIQTLKIPGEKVIKIYQGFESATFQKKYTETEIRKINEKYHLPEKYILSVGHLEPRKNYNRLLEAFAILKNKDHIPHKLIIVGQENWLFESIFRDVERLGLKSAVQFVGFVIPEDLPALYQLADIFVLPSVFEGFGFPPLESMAAGTPVACSNVTSLPEVCGDAAVLFDPYNIADMRLKMRQLLEDESLKKSLVKKGFENLNRFSWKECAEKTAQVLNETLG